MAKNKKKRRCFSVIISIVIAVLVGITIFQSMQTIKLSPSLQPAAQLDNPINLVSVFAISFISMIVIGVVIYYILVTRREA